MKERPILFSAPMVRAILAGTKTQTRRAIKTHRRDDSFVCVDHGAGWWPYRSEDGESEVMSDSCEYPYTCPYGVPGDRLWVRETCRAHELTDKEAEADTFGVMERKGLECPLYGLDGVIYKADGAFREIGNTREASDLWAELNAYRGKSGATVPPIHMPRWASRITLEITDVRVERLQEISQADAIAEGAPPSHPTIDNVSRQYGHEDFSRSWYAQLWDQINGAGSWDANPWVWALSFRRLP